MTAPSVLHLTTVELSLRLLLLDQLRAIRDAGFDVTTMSAPGVWAPRLEEEGIRHVAWPSAVRAWDPRADVRAYRELRAVVGGFDVVHTHTPKPGILGRVAARRAGVPCVVNTVHGYHAAPGDPLPRRAAVMGLERLATACSDLELFQSGEDFAWARRSGVVPPHKARLLGNGIDLARFSRSAVDVERVAALRAELGLEQDARVVTMVGRLVAAKGCRELFAAARAVRRERPDVRFVVVGGSDVGKVGAIGPEEQAAAAADVVFTGWRQDVETVLALTDVFVLPSWGPEGMPRVAMEAAALGLPMVLTDIRGCREVGRDGREALLVAPRDAPALIRAIGTLLDDADLRRRLGAAAAERAHVEFDQQRVFATVIAEYERLLRAGGRRTVERGAVVRRAVAGDAAGIARLHRERIPTGFLPTLGDAFLARLYSALIADREAVVLVTGDAGAPDGFAAGVVSSRRFGRRFLRRHGVAALAAAAPRLVRPANARRLLETARYTGATGSAEEAEVVAVAVSEAAAGSGVASALLQGVAGGLADLGAERVRVVTAAGNVPAGRAFAAAGFERAGALSLHDNVDSVVWTAACPS